MGGKNPVIVMEDADVDLAVEGLLWGAYGTTGQRCTATSRLIVHADVHDAVVEKLTARATALRLGYGNDDATEMGPLINQKALDKVTGYMDVARAGRRDDRLRRRARRRARASTTASSSSRRSSRASRATCASPARRSSGPSSRSSRSDSFDEAIATANDVIYGLSSALYTKDVTRAFRAMRDLDAGITYINGPTIGAEAHMSFGGVKATGNGHREGGWEVYDFYTETKTIYVDFSGGLQRAQIDNYVEDI